MSLLKENILGYRKIHQKLPDSVVITPHAAIVMSAMGIRLTGIYMEVPLSVSMIDGSDAVKIGEGSRLGLFVRDTGANQYVAAVELK